MSIRAYKFRFYPTDEQENLLRRTMGCVRLVYNKALATRTEAWYERQERQYCSVKGQVRSLQTKSCQVISNKEYTTFHRWIQLRSISFTFLKVVYSLLEIT